MNKSNAILILVSLLLLPAGCTRTLAEMRDETPVALVFNTPAVGPSTKADPGAPNAEMGVNYSTSEHFSVYALAHTAPFASLTTPAELSNYYIENEECEWEPSINAWAPQHPYFWLPPAVGSFYLSFQAYSPSAARDDCSVSHDWTGGFSFSGFRPRAVGSQYDLLYSDRHLDKQRPDYTPGVPYDEISGDGAAYNGIDIRFRHALSSIRFKIKANVDEHAIQTIRLQSIRVINVWDNASFAQHLDGGTPVWTPDGDAAEVSYYAYRNTGAAASGVQLTSTPYVAPDLLLLIPQNLDHGTNHVKIEVRYSRTTGGSTSITTDTIDLVTGKSGSYFQYDDGGTPVNIEEWKMGYRYTYNFTVNLFKIFVDPTVDHWNDRGSIEIDI